MRGTLISKNSDTRRMGRRTEVKIGRAQGARKIIMNHVSIDSITKCVGNWH